MQTFVTVDSNWQEEKHESLKKKIEFGYCKILHPFVWGKGVKIFQMVEGEGGGRGR